MSEPDTGRPVVKTLLLTDFVESTQFVSSLGDVKAAEVFAAHDHAARELLAEHGGQEIDKSDGFLFLFDRPISAVRFSLAYHRLLAELSQNLPRPLEARTGIHLGEVVMRTNPTDDVVRGAKPVEVEGLAKAKTARVMSCATGGQTLLSESAYTIGHRAAVGAEGFEDDVRWVELGEYDLKGIEEPVRLFAVGHEGDASLQALAGQLAARASGGMGRVAMVALLLVAAGAGFAWWQSNQTVPAPTVSKPAPTPPPAKVTPPPTKPAPVKPAPAAVARKQLTLHIESRPAGAQIRYGDDVLGPAPVTLPVPPSVGGHPVQAALSGYRPGQAFCRITEADLAAGKANCTVELRRLRKARPASKKAGPTVKPKPKAKTKIHMID